MADTDYRVGVLSLHNSKETKAILNALDELGADPVWLRRENVAIGIEDGDVSLEPDVDAVLNRLLLSNTPNPEELLGLGRCLSTLRPTLNDPNDVLGALHKYATATTLAEADIRVPDALLALDEGRLNERRPNFGAEAVFKTAIGTHGGGTWKVRADEDVNPMVGDRFAFLQSLVEREGAARHRDLRVYVVGDEIVGAMHRYAPDSDWRTNVALGGSVEGVEDVPAEAREFALQSADALGLDYAGVDLVEGADGWYVLEVNPTAGFKGLFSATSVSPAPHIARLGIEAAGGSVPDAAVADLEDTFDFSRPPGILASVGTASETKTIGYTEEVLVSGTSGSEQVTAKSDTGAARTSVDTELAADIGAGPIRSMTTVKSGSAPGGTSRPVVDIVVGVGGDRHTVAASLTDRSNLRYPLLLGRDILGDYQVDVSRTVGEE
ncbi:MAG: RimK/LysX family protein [Halobacteriaceae archaeon]